MSAPTESKRAKIGDVTPYMPLSDEEKTTKCREIYESERTKNIPGGIMLEYHFKYLLENYRDANEFAAKLSKTQPAFSKRLYTLNPKCSGTGVIYVIKALSLIGDSDKLCEYKKIFKQNPNYLKQFLYQFFFVTIFQIPKLG